MENGIKTNEIQSFTQKINFGQTKYTCYTVYFPSCSVTNRNENWAHIVLDKTGVVYQLYGKQN